MPYTDNFMSSTVHAQTAPAPEGPWSQPVALHKQEPITNGSTIYAAAPHPYYDPSGKTLVVTFTNHPNTIQAIRIVSRIINHALMSMFTNRFVTDICIREASMRHLTGVDLDSDIARIDDQIRQNAHVGNI